MRALDEGFARYAARVADAALPAPDDERPADDEGATASEAPLPTSSQSQYPKSQVRTVNTEPSRLEEELNGTIALTGQPSSARAKPRAAHLREKSAQRIAA